MERLPYGPNTAAVRRFLQRFAALDATQWDEAAARLAALEGTPRFRRADQALGVAIERAGRTAERDAVVGPLLGIARPAEGATEPPAVAAAALAAALGLMMRDVLDPDVVATLYAPMAPLVAMPE